jgi:hypothetical protein
LVERDQYGSTTWLKLGIMVIKTNQFNSMS